MSVYKRVPIPVGSHTLTKHKSCKTKWWTDLSFVLNCSWNTFQGQCEKGLKKRSEMLTSNLRPVFGSTFLPQEGKGISGFENVNTAGALHGCGRLIHFNTYLLQIFLNPILSVPPEQYLLNLWWQDGYRALLNIQLLTWGPLEPCSDGFVCLNATLWLSAMLSPFVNRSPFPANSSFKAATNFSLIFSLCGGSDTLVTAIMT